MKETDRQAVERVLGGSPDELAELYTDYAVDVIRRGGVDAVNDAPAYRPIQRLIALIGDEAAEAADERIERRLPQLFRP